MDKILTLPLELQVGLGGGFLAYMIASTGLRRGHTTIDVLMRSLAFGLPGILLMHLLAPLMASETPVGDPDSSETAQGSFLVGVAAVSLSIAIGALWRKWARDWWGWALKRADIHRDDGLLTAWDTMLESRDFNVTQVSVRLKNGREFFMENPAAYKDGPAKGLITGVEGDLVMVVDYEILPDGTEEARTHQVDPVWGTRLTYIPAAEIQTVEFRCIKENISGGEAAGSEKTGVTPESGSSPESVTG